MQFQWNSTYFFVTICSLRAFSGIRGFFEKNVEILWHQLFTCRIRGIYLEFKEKLLKISVNGVNEAMPGDPYKSCSSRGDGVLYLQ